MAAASDSGSLDEARARIDRIDDRILDLLGERAEIVEEVVQAKRSAGEETRSSFRPEREAAILRRLHARLHRRKTGLSFEGVARVWREIMSAALLQQEPVSVGVQGATGVRGAELRALARLHFGSGVVITACVRMEDLYRAVRRDRTLIGLVPSLSRFAIEAVGRRDGPMIFAALPFWGTGMPRAYAFGHVQLAGTDDDVTLLTLRRRQDVSVRRVSQALAGIGISACYEGGSGGQSVFALDGFHVSEQVEARIGEALRPHIRQWRLLGAYARPLGEESEDSV